jgi:hypothetical protein
MDVVGSEAVAHIGKALDILFRISEGNPLVLLGSARAICWIASGRKGSTV